eukprot:Hpha_TRINITY_DN13464_c0_g1::TRINITY_DN13464_c0_g1_i1::g.130928::m.130928/K07944/ARL3; ADP-ribosylation factor-like protein 3
MGILDFLKGLKRTTREARILVLGLDNAGKTSCLRKLSAESIEQVVPTQGFNIKTLCHDGFKLNVWDIGGNVSLRPYWADYYAEADAIVFVVDSADRYRLEQCGVELELLLQRQELAALPLLVLANKQDLLAALPASDIAEALNLRAVRDREWQIQPSSAKTGDGLREGMEWLVKSLESGKSLDAERRRTPVEPLPSTEKAEPAPQPPPPAPVPAPPAPKVLQQQSVAATTAVAAATHPGP